MHFMDAIQCQSIVTNNLFSIEVSSTEDPFGDAILKFWIDLASSLTAQLFRFPIWFFHFGWFIGWLLAILLAFDYHYRFSFCVRFPKFNWIWILNSEEIALKSNLTIFSRYKYMFVVYACQCLAMWFGSHSVFQFDWDASFE